MIQPGSRFKVILQIFARVLFRESSSRFISVGRRPIQSEIPASFNCRLVMNIRCSFRVTPQSAQPSHSGRVRRSILPWAFLLPGFPAIEPFDLPLQKINIRSWLSRRRGFLKCAIDASKPIAFQKSSILQRFEGSNAWPKLSQPDDAFASHSIQNE